MFASLSMALGGSVFLLLLVALIAVILAVLFYRVTLPPLPRRVRIILSAIRAAALVLLLLLLFEPIARSVHHSEMPPAVAVLVDASQSMSLVDAGGDRAAELKTFLQWSGRNLRVPGATVLYYPFASKLSPAEESPPDSLALTGETTDLGGALSAVREFIPQRNIRSVVIVSDGEYTAGRNPLYPAESLGVPIYSVGVGDTTEQKDLLIDNVKTNDIVFAGDHVPVDVTLKSSGYDNTPVDVTLREGSSVLDHSSVTLRSSQPLSSVRLYVDPKEEGTKRYVVDVTKLPGELTDRNNSRSVMIKVRKSRLKILVIGGAPLPDVASVEEMLKEDEHHSVSVVVQKSPEELYGNRAGTLTPDSADCLVLVGYPTAASSPAFEQRIVEAIAQKRRPVLFIGGKGIDPAKIAPLEPYLPFTLSGGRRATEGLVFPSIPERAKLHSLVTQDGAVSVAAWQKLPPIYRAMVDVRAKPESDILSLCTAENMTLTEPLIAARSIAHQRAVGISGYGVWRWKLMVQGDPATERLFTTFLNNAVRWLTTSDEDKRVRVTPVNDAVTTAEPVQFTAQVYDEQLRPTDDAEVRVDISRGAEKTSVILNPAGNGRYEGSVSGLGEGDYTYQARATAGGTQLGEDRGRFSVGLLNVEFLQTRLNQSLLEQLSYRTGGTYFPASRPDSIPAAIASKADLKPREVVRATEIELWHWQYVAALVILLFGAEWVVRKRSGMI